MKSTETLLDSNQSILAVKSLIPGEPKIKIVRTEKPTPCAGFEKSREKVDLAVLTSNRKVYAGIADFSRLVCFEPVAYSAV